MWWWQGLELWVFLEGHTQLGGGGTGVFQASAWGELMRLVNASSLVVTEDMPVSPYATWLQVGTVPPPSSHACMPGTRCAWHHWAACLVRS